MTIIPTMVPPCTVPMMPFTPAMQAGVQGAVTPYAITPALGPSVHATVTVPTATWPTTLYGAGYGAGAAYSAAPGAAPQASLTPVSGSATVTFSAGVSGTIGPTVTNDTPGEPGRPPRPPISRRACDVTRNRAAAAEELTIAPTMLPALCMAPTLEQQYGQPYGMWPYGAMAGAPYGAVGAYTAPYWAGAAYSAAPGAAPQASLTPVSGSATVTFSAGVSGTIGPTVTNDTPGEPGRPPRPPISRRACDVTRNRAAAAEELTIAPTLLPALCMAPTLEQQYGQPYGMWPYGAMAAAPYGAGASYAAPGAAPQASLTPVSGSATVTFSAGVSGTVGPTVTNDTPGEPGRPPRPPISRRACDVTRNRAAAAEELTIAPTMLPALCMAPTLEQQYGQPYGMWPYGAMASAPYGAGASYAAPGAAPQALWTPVSGAVEELTIVPTMLPGLCMAPTMMPTIPTAQYTQGTGWAAQSGAAAQAMTQSVWPTITHHVPAPQSVWPTITYTRPAVQPAMASFTGPSHGGGVAYPQYTVTVPPILSY